jgi:hypothetical protein
MFLIYIYIYIYKVNGCLALLLNEIMILSGDYKTNTYLSKQWRELRWQAKGMGGEFILMAVESTWKLFPYCFFNNIRRHQ